MKSLRPLLTPARIGRFTLLLALFTSLLGGGCDGGQSGAEVATGNGGGDPPAGDDPPLGGGEDPVAVVCETDEQCRETTRHVLDSLSAPHPQSFELSSSVCEAYGVLYGDRQLSGPACTCTFGDAGPRTVGPLGGGCSFKGRGGECLLSDAEFPGCSIVDPHACDATCTELGRRLTADAERRLQMDLTYARCDQSAAEVITEDGCQSVVEIGGLCYPNY